MLSGPNLDMYIIAEIAQAHEGSLGIAHSYIDALSETGVDAVKFQVHIAEAESSDFEPFRVKFSIEDLTRFDYWKRMEFTKDQWAGLKLHCEEKGLEFMASPFSNAAVDLLESIGIKRYKIGSGELNNYLMLQKIANTGKPIIVSSGMSDWEELDQCIAFLKKSGNVLSLMQCTTAYPTQPEQWGLDMLKIMKERYQLPVGFSDHSATIYAGLAAATLRAEMLEFHVVFDKSMFGPDAKASLTLAETKIMTDGIRMIERSILNKSDKSNIEHFKDLKTMFGKSLAVNRDLPLGHILSFDDLESKKPADKGISAKEFEKVLGQKLKTDLNQWSFLNWNDLE